MALKHDAQGFLIGDPVDFGRALEVWGKIHDDIKAIRQALASGKSPSSTRSAPTGTPTAAAPTARPGIARSANDGSAANRATAALPRARDEMGRFSSVKRTRPSGERDEKGRFLPGDGRPGVGGAPDENGPSGEDGNALAAAINRISSAAKEAVAGSENIDPGVKAFNEVARPVTRGYEMLSGGRSDKRQEGWLRRIWTSLTGFRKEEAAFSKAATKSLKGIEEKPVAEKGGGGLFGGIGSMFSNLLSRVPLLGNLLGGRGGGAAGGSVAGKVGAQAGGLLSRAGGVVAKGAKGLMRRIPLLGTLLMGADAASEIYASETDGKASREKKDKRTGRAVGGFAGGVSGMLAGGAAGAAIGSVVPVIGTAIGGVLGAAAGAFFGDKAGQILGETLGGWVSGMRASWGDIKAVALGVFDWIRGGWDSVVAVASEVFGKVSEVWNSAVEIARGVFDRFSDFLASVIGGLKELPIIGPVIKGIETVVKAAPDAVRGAKDIAVEAAGNAATVVKNKAGQAWDATTEAAGNAVPDSLKAKIEARRQQEMAAQRGAGDPTAAAAGVPGTQLGAGTRNTTAIAMTAQGRQAVTAPRMAAVTASTKAQPVKTAPAIQPVPAAQGVTVPLATGKETSPVVVALPAQDVGQDVRDRGIAHIVTGGLGG